MKTLYRFLVLMLCLQIAACAGIKPGTADEDKQISPEITGSEQKDKSEKAEIGDEKIPSQTEEQPVSAVSVQGPWNIAEIDTARNVSYLTDEEKDVILEVNMVRTNPAAYAEMYLVPRRENFHGYIYKRPGKIDLRTREGRRALDECVSVLKKAKIRPPLKPSRVLSMASMDHVKDTGPKGRTGHNGTNGSTMRTRIEKHGSWDTRIGENISYGFPDARNIIIQLIVDDGVSSRGHRKNLLSTKFKFIGTSVGSHKRYGHMCVMDFAGAVSD